MDQEKRAILLRISLDVLCILVVGLPILLFFIAGRPFERGFFCDDESLRHPFKESTVPSWVLYVFGLGIPIATIIASEFIIGRTAGRSKPLTITKYTIPGWIQEVYKHVGVFGFGAVVSQLTTDIGKYTIGRLRPHFFDVCNPTIDCNDQQWRYKYIQSGEYTCQNSNQKLIKDMRLSFPSGHSSFSMYCMLFVAAVIMTLALALIYNILYDKKGIGGLFLALSLAIATALSRVSDYKHHWSDVLSGVVIGALVAIVTVVFVSDLFPREGHSFQIVAETSDPQDPSVNAAHPPNGHQSSAI